MFTDEHGEIIYGPGDDVLRLHQKAPLGTCAVTLHLMGYWYDSTKQGPLLCLSKLSRLPKGSEKAYRTDFVSTPPSERAAVIRNEIKSARDRSPPAPGSPGSYVRCSPLAPSSPVAIPESHRQQRIWQLSEASSALFCTESITESPGGSPAHKYNRSSHAASKSLGDLPDMFARHDAK